MRGLAELAGLDGRGARPHTPTQPQPGRTNASAPTQMGMIRILILVTSALILLLAIHERRDGRGRRVSPPTKWLKGFGLQERWRIRPRFLSF